MVEASYLSRFSTSHFELTINEKEWKNVHFIYWCYCALQKLCNACSIVEQLCFWLATVKLCSRVGKSMLEWIEDKLFSLSVTTLSHCCDTRQLPTFFERTFSTQIVILSNFLRRTFMMIVLHIRKWTFIILSIWKRWWFIGSDKKRK